MPNNFITRNPIKLGCLSVLLAIAGSYCWWNREEINDKFHPERPRMSFCTTDYKEHVYLTFFAQAKETSQKLAKMEILCGDRVVYERELTKNEARLNTKIMLHEEKLQYGWPASFFKNVYTLRATDDKGNTTSRTFRKKRGFVIDTYTDFSESDEWRQWRKE